MAKCCCHHSFWGGCLPAASWKSLATEDSCMVTAETTLLRLLETSAWPPLTIYNCWNALPSLSTSLPLLSRPPIY